MLSGNDLLRERGLTTPSRSRSRSSTSDTLLARERERGRGRETVHLPASALEALKKLPRGLGDALVFARPDGSPLRPDSFTAWFGDLLEECGVRAGIGPHDFGRHGCVSLMASQGASMKQCQRHLRHSSITMTMDLSPLVRGPPEGCGGTARRDIEQRIASTANE